jgi:hypothetical protein
MSFNFTNIKENISAIAFWIMHVHACRIVPA